MFPIDCDICILQGADWQPVAQWLGEDMLHQIISDVQIGLPTLLTVTAHGFDVGARMPVWITNVQGPRALNTDGYRCVDPRWATVVDANTLAVDFDSGSLLPYKSGGVLTTRPPVDLTGWTARQEIRSAIDAPDVLSELTTDTGGGITLGADGTITRHMTAAQTTALGLALGGAAMAGVYNLELTDTTGVVWRFAQGAVSVSPDFAASP